LSICHNGKGTILRIFVILLLSLFVAPCSRARASDQDSGMSQYLHQRWGDREGFVGTPNAIAQTPDGYLWVATDMALFRFDGQSWLKSEMSDTDAQPIDHVLGLTVDAEGVMWIWLQGTRILCYKDGKILEAFPSRADEQGVTAMARGNRHGILMSVSQQHIVRSLPGGLEQLGTSPGPTIVSIAQTSDDRIWLGTRDAGLYYLHTPADVPVIGELPDTKINCLLATKSGGLWIGTDNGLSLWDKGKLSKEPIPTPLDHAQIRSFVEDGEGTLWVGTQAGLVRLRGGDAVSIPNAEGVADAITAVFLDSEGDIWLGDSHGIERLRQSTFTNLSTGKGFPVGEPGPIYVDPAGRTWFALKQGGLYYLQNGRVTQVKAAGLDSDIVYSIDGRKDDVWLGRQRGGLTHLHVGEGDISTESYHPGTGLYKDILYTVHVDSDGSVWAGTLTGGAVHVENSKMQSFTADDGLGSDAVTAIEESTDGTMWFATPTRLTSFSAGHWHSYFERDGLPGVEVISLLQDGKNGLWIGTANGLAYFSNGSILSKFRDNRFAHEMILGLAKGPQGSLWVSTADKIISLNADRLLHTSSGPIDWQTYGAADGLPGTNGVRRSRSMVADAQGRVWLSTNSGLSMVDTTTAFRSTVPTIAHVEGVRIDGSTQSLSDNRLLHVSAGSKRLEFDFIGLDLAAPESVRYRYRLDGLDHNWIDAGQQRTAVYANLPPGRYVFRVSATNRGGDWSDIEASIPVVIAPQVWQTWEFRVACCLSVMLLSFLLYFLHVQKIATRANLIFEERLAERTRIAQDLHDTLLQGFFSASMQLNVIADKAQPESIAKSQLVRVIDLMGKVLDQGRDAVQGLRSAGVRSMWLDDSIRIMFKDIGLDDGITQSVRLSGIPRPLRLEPQEEVCRIVQEALGNSYRHARATLITVQIVYSSRFLEVEVRDNGCGIEPHIISHGRQGHWGLLGMRERAKRLRAKLQIKSRTNDGTIVTLTVPGQVVYSRYATNPFLNRAIEFSRAEATSTFEHDSGEDSQV